ncbi:hypothetical protein IR166_07125, partial [Enterococcus faecalis]|nr:hypothetical protein [Enterococcus faecalis]
FRETIDSLNSCEYRIVGFLVCIIKTPLLDYNEQSVRISSIGAKAYNKNPEKYKETVAAFLDKYIK